ncbi:hypothetical protein VTO73DRAFT_10355 [Trametes versicolor]
MDFDGDLATRQACWLPPTLQLEMYAVPNSLATPVLSDHTSSTSLAARPVGVLATRIPCKPSIACPGRDAAEHGCATNEMSLLLPSVSLGPALCRKSLSPRGPLRAEFGKFTHFATSTTQKELDWNAARCPAVYHHQRRHPTMFWHSARWYSTAVALSGESLGHTLYVASPNVTARNQGAFRSRTPHIIHPGFHCRPSLKIASALSYLEIDKLRTSELRRHLGCDQPRHAEMRRSCNCAMYASRAASRDLGIR